jgi:hypothetical protein
VEELEEEYALIREAEGEEGVALYKLHLSESKRDPFAFMSRREGERRWEAELARSEDYPHDVRVIVGNRSTSVDPCSSWWLDRAAVEGVFPALRIPPREIGKTFRCVIPGHELGKRRADASIDPKSFEYVCWHDRKPEYKHAPSRQLAEVFASQRAGKAVRLRGGTLGRWGDRLLYQAGLLDLGGREGHDVRVIVPHGREEPLKASAIKVLDGFLLAYALGTLHHENGVMFSVEFAIPWCGVSKSSVERALSALRKRDLIRKVGEQQKGLTTNLYTPGDGTRRRKGWTDDKYTKESR